MNARQKDEPISAWLNNLEQALGSLPADDSLDILAEAKEHIDERVGMGISPFEVLAGFGSAHAYAQGFVDEYLLTRARSSRRTIPMLRTVIRFAQRSVVAAFGLICATISGFFGLWSLVCIAIKIFRPDLVGLWLDLPLSEQHRYVHSQRDFVPLSFGHDHIVFGFQNPPPQFPEHLGMWIYPCLAGIAFLSYFALRASLLAALKRIQLPAGFRPCLKVFPKP
ncbi:MAG TPA: hypothetical protein VMS18_07620 [Candidatus Binatia bacterium]|nr:hypothetical protein [Candidatus Binatia bacterium]